MRACTGAPDANAGYGTVFVYRGRVLPIVSYKVCGAKAPRMASVLTLLAKYDTVGRRRRESAVPRPLPPCCERTQKGMVMQRRVDSVTLSAFYAPTSWKAAKHLVEPDVC
eukprot:1783440-Pleurochrysis_carterae.AAC.3